MNPFLLDILEKLVGAADGSEVLVSQVVRQMRSALPAERQSNWTSSTIAQELADHLPTRESPLGRVLVGLHLLRR